MRERALAARRSLVRVASFAVCVLVTTTAPLRGQQPYQPTWESLAQHPVPRWFLDAKFGVYWHWGVYSVPAFGNEWYPRHMYEQGHIAFQYHLDHFGPQAEFGYKDFVPYFRAEKFDPWEWADLLVRSGARFAGPVAQHHDGFAMWASDLTDWDVMDRGPKRDIVGELEAAIRARGLKFMVSFHHTRKWWYYEPSYQIPSDTRDPCCAGDHAIYPPPHEPGDPPTEGYIQDWAERVKEVVDKYRPDLIWFDHGLNEERFFRTALPRFREVLRQTIAFYYNRAAGWGQEVTVTYKHEDLPPGVGILDLERGRMGELRKEPWLTDTSVMRNSWCYVQHPDYKPVNELVDVLVDIVSKNGCMLLNIGPRPDGTIPPEQKAQLEAMGEWLRVNGEAIYETRPWSVYGEGPHRIEGGAFSERKEVQYTWEDIRFTKRGNVLYAITLDWPPRRFVIRSLRGMDAEQIASVSLLGHSGSLKWQMTAEGLQIELPNLRPCDHAYAFKIQFKGASVPEPVGKSGK